MNSQRAASLTRTDFLIASLLGITAMTLYVRTLAPSLLWGDSAEFQTLSYTLGMTHPSGYMTQIMFGKLFTYIPVGNIAYRVNLMSAFFGALAVAETYLIVRLLGGWRIAGISASILLTLTEGFWWRALLAESYAPAAGMLATRRAIGRRPLLSRHRQERRSVWTWPIRSECATGHVRAGIR